MAAFTLGLEANSKEIKEIYVPTAFEELFACFGGACIISLQLSLHTLSLLTVP